MDEEIRTPDAAAEPEAQTGMPTVQLDDENFGVVLNAAIKHTLNRQAMSLKVMNFISPLIPYLSSKALKGMDEELTESLLAAENGMPIPNAELWEQLRQSARAERSRRGEALYVSWARRKKEYPFRDVSE